MKLLFICFVVLASLCTLSHGVGMDLATGVVARLTARSAMDVIKQNSTANRNDYDNTWRPQRRYGDYYYREAPKIRMWAGIPDYRPVQPQTTTTSTTTRRPYNVRRPGVPPAFSTYQSRPYYAQQLTQRPLLPFPSDKPETCDTSYDAVALLRGELFIFKDRYHWRVGNRGLYPSYPLLITRMWSSLPRSLTHVDAVYERPDQKIAIFIGQEFYLFDSNYLLPGYPKPLTDLGLPENLEKVDAAMVWGKTGDTIFFSGNLFWRYDEATGRVLDDYPRDIGVWEGVGYNIDSALQWKDGKTYFFKGKGFWKFNDDEMRVENDKQYPSAQFWMGCSEGFQPY